MELAAILFMLIGGGAIAVFVLIAIAIAKREHPDDPVEAPKPGREHIAASVLFHILTLGGTAADEAMRAVRRGAGLAAPITPSVDVANWADRYSQMSSPPQRAWLLETAVQLVATRTRAVPLRQYNALLDLSFALGFQTDALAKLREQYGFEYVDHAKNARPREADRAGGSVPLFVREQRSEAECLRVLGIEGTPTRQIIISAYRKLVAQHHPDRFHGQSIEAETAAAARFIEITRAYETLMVIYKD